MPSNSIAQKQLFCWGHCKCAQLGPIPQSLSAAAVLFLSVCTAPLEDSVDALHLTELHQEYQGKR